MSLSTGWILTSGEISLSPYLPVDGNQVVSTARLIQSDKDLLILNHINIDFPNLSLSGEQMLPQGQIKGRGHLESSQAGQKAPFPLIQRGKRWRQAVSPPSALWGPPRSKAILKLDFSPPPFHFSDSTDTQCEQGAHGRVQSPLALPGLH